MGTWGSGVVGGEEVGGEAADFAGFPFLRCLFALLLGEKATNFSVFPHLRCLLGFLPALKATDFAGFPFLRCLFALLRGEKATNFSAFPHLRCLLGFLPALKATDFAGFPFLRCLLPCSAVKRQRISVLSPIYVAFPPTPPKTNFFAKPIVTPPLVWYNTGYHRIVIQGIIVCFQACLHGWGTSFETLVQSTGMEI